VTNKTSVLDGCRVLDLTRFLSGPQATLFLAGMGAEVIRIDEPNRRDLLSGAPPFAGPKGVSLQKQTPDDLGIAYLKRLRGKKAITLDLKQAAGRELFFRLVAEADVVVENFRGGVTKRLGIEYPDLARVNPRIVHCAISGYGATGPEARSKAYDLMVQAASGLMSITGAPDGGPSKTGSPLSDCIAGTFAVAGILGALLHRERTGKGQSVDVSMADCLFALMFDEPLDCYARLGLAMRQGNRIMRVSPFNSYPTRDGGIVIGVSTKEDWIAFLKVIGREDLLGNANWNDVGWRVANNAEVDAMVSAWTRTLTRADALARLAAADIASSPIRDIREVMGWEHLRGRGMIETLLHPVHGALDGVQAPGFPLKFSDSATGYHTPAALTGAHNAEIYGSLLGLSSSELASLMDRQII
jgi:crotonobetainyl-CoA:carnitine CoA-transferase CaiB-like acyl-CoA transferase